jgi:hypothetical protein
MPSPERDAFDHRPDPVLGSALREALDAPDRSDQQAFVARVMAGYDAALERATVPTWEVLASWSRRGLAAAVIVALAAGFWFGRATLLPQDSEDSIAAAISPAERPGITALVTAADPPDASVVLTSLVEPR